MITLQDYIQILNFYKFKIPKSRKSIQEKASNILAIKLCRCLRKKNSKKETLSVGICTNSIFSKKGLERKEFTCKKKPKLIFDKFRNSKKNKTQKKTLNLKKDLK